MKRRRLLALGGATIPAAIAGCTTTESSEGETEDGSDEGGDNESENDHSPSPADDPGAETEADWPTGPYADYDSTVVEIHGDDGTELGRVRAALAQTGDQRYLGLSDAESLPEGAGMLFVYTSPGNRRYVMRRMDFGLDIVYVGADRAINSIHHAPAPGPDEDGSTQSYPGTGQYVLEVNYQWTSERGITEGDELVFEL